MERRFFLPPEGNAGGAGRVRIRGTEGSHIARVVRWPRIALGGAKKCRRSVVPGVEEAAPPSSGYPPSSPGKRTLRGDAARLWIVAPARFFFGDLGGFR